MLDAGYWVLDIPERGKVYSKFCVQRFRVQG
jgi:hypothetical protein